MTCSRGCVLAVVGSTLLDGPEAVAIVTEIIQRHAPTLIVSGGAPGIDTVAQRVADSLHIPFVPVRPRMPSWTRGFKPRNEVIARACICLARVSSERGTTYGSGWTADLAEKFGRNVERWELP